MNDQRPAGAMSLETAGYRRERIGRALAVVREEGLAFVRDAVGAAGTLYDYAASLAGAEPIKGRGTVYLIPGPGRRRWVVRRLSHGGLLAPLTGDRFLRLGVPRPVNELSLALRLQELGVPTPRVAAALVYPAGLVYRGEVARDEITGALDLAACLFGGRRLAEPERRAALSAAGELIAALHRAGVIHPDLNLRNVLVRLGDEGPRAYILDVEKCRVAARLSNAARERMLRRFRRSARKFEEGTGERLSRAEWEALQGSYGQALEAGAAR